MKNRIILFAACLLSSSLSLYAADGKITITRSLSLSLQLITPALYPQYYLLMSEWYESAKSPLLFRQL